MRLKFVEPLMPTLVKKPPEGDDWIHEVKCDGYRSKIVKYEPAFASSPAAASIATKYRDLAQAAAALEVDTAIIDGEIVVLNEAGLSDFGVLRKAITRRHHDLYFVAFDLLHLNGKSCATRHWKIGATFLLA